jgi:hypothetical protein
MINKYVYVWMCATQSSVMLSCMLELYLNRSSLRDKDVRLT